METVEHIKNLPMLGNDAIHIWGARVPELEDRVEDLKALLCEAEVAKAERFYRPADQASSIVARGALRMLLSGYTGNAASELRFQYLETGKPYLAVPQVIARMARNLRLPGSAESRRRLRDLRAITCGTEKGKQECPPHEIAFNVSHSGEWVVLAIGRNRNIGVDVEKIRREMDVMSIASRYFTPEEAALIESAEDVHALFFHHWSRKEAYIKAIGSALFRELSTFAVPNDDVEKDGWFFQRLEAGSKYAAAVVSDNPIQDLPCYDFTKLSW
jgi:4'-phosphopantetheinyl transferase